MSDVKKTAERPLSPHLQVYRLPLTAITSILHRITGAALSVGTILLVWMLMAAATGPREWNAFQDVAGSGFGKLLLFGWSVALFYHLCNGIRHLFWDMGYFFKREQSYRAGYVVLAATALLTILTWVSL